MDWIKVKTVHILDEYTDLSDCEFRAWIKIMALTARLEHEPMKEQMLNHIHHKTLISIQDKLKKHSTDLQGVLKKVLIDTQGVVLQRQYWKQKQQEKRASQQSVKVDVNETSKEHIDKIRLDKNIKENKQKKSTPPPLVKMKFSDSVFLSAIEHQKLTEAIGQKTLEIGIEQLDYSITVKGGKYKDHYKTILNWYKRGFLKGNGSRPPPQSGERDVPLYVGEPMPEVSDEERQANIERIKQFTAGIG